MAVLISVGSINADFQMRVERWPEAGETLPGTEFLLAGGGKAANVAFLARKLGVKSRLIARTGDDELADVALRPLTEAGVDLSCTRRIRGQRTGSASILVQPDGEKGIFLALNANESWNSAEDLAEAEAAARKSPEGSVVVADLEVSPSVVERCFETARELGFPTILDPSPASKVNDRLLRLSDFITPNPSEARQMSDIQVTSFEDGWRCGERLCERGAGCVLAKLPRGGCAVLSGRDRFSVEPEEVVQVVDKTGAGDAFAGAFAVGILEQRHLREAVRMAVATAGIAVGRYGSQAAYPKRGDLEAKLRTDR